MSLSLPYQETDVNWLRWLEEFRKKLTKNNMLHKK